MLALPFTVAHHPHDVDLSFTMQEISCSRYRMKPVLAQVKGDCKKRLLTNSAQIEYEIHLRHIGIRHDRSGFLIDP